LVRLDILEWADFSDRFSEHLVARKPQKIAEEWIHIVDAARFEIQN